MPLTTHEALTAGLAPIPAVTADDVAAAQARASRTAIRVVLDDDPTGTQSVANLPVLTSWEEEDFLWALGSGVPAVYVMTNSRSLAPEDAERVNREVVASALAAATALGLTQIGRASCRERV